MGMCSTQKDVRDRTTPKSNGVSGPMRGQHMLQLVVGNKGGGRAVDVDAEPSEYLLLRRLRVGLVAGIGICTLSGWSVRSRCTSLMTRAYLGRDPTAPVYGERAHRPLHV
jgi:hypothetical protein